MRVKGPGLGVDRKLGVLVKRDHTSGRISIRKLNAQKSCIINNFVNLCLNKVQKEKKGLER